MTPVVTDRGWVLKSVSMQAAYEKKSVSQEQTSRDGQYDTVILYMYRNYVVDVYMYEDVDPPSLNHILSYLRIMLPGGYSMHVKLPSLDSSGQGITRVANPGGGEWQLRGWANVFDPETERWMTTARIAGSWNYKIGLKQYDVVNWE